MPYIDKHTWQVGEVITQGKMNNIEDNIQALVNEVTSARTYSGQSSNTLGARIDDLVIVSDTTPTEPNNEIWLDTSNTEGSGTRTVEVPSMEDLHNLESSIADAGVYTEGNSYAVGDYVYYEESLYQCNTAITNAGTWDSSKWDNVNLSDVIATVNQNVAENTAAVGELKSALTSNRTGTIELNPLAAYRYSSDSLSVVDFASMPLNTYAYAKFSVFKTALTSAGFPLTWGDNDYVYMLRMAASRNSQDISIISLYNFTKTDKAEMIYFASTSGNKYRWLLPTTDLTKQYYPADAKTVGDALALKEDASELTGNRDYFYIKPWGQYKFTDSGASSVDFRDMPVNTYFYTTYSAIKVGMTGTIMPDNDWADGDYVAVFKRAITNNTATDNSIVEFYNLTKTRKLEMIYYATSSENKYRWLLPSTDLTKQYAAADAKTVGDALATKLTESDLLSGRSDVTLYTWGGYTTSGDAVDFRDMPLNTYAFTRYSAIKAGFSDTNFPDNDWADADYVAIFKKKITPNATVANSIIIIYNLTKTRRLEMIYYASSSGNKYRWILTSGGTNYNTFTNTINQYDNTYNVTVTPSITTDTNNYLQSTGDQTDVATAIVTMLTQTGVCNLGPGDFYVSGIDMPYGSTIRGSGNATTIILLDSVTNGYAIKMGQRCTVEDVTISGGTTAPTITSEIGTRNGILWQGTAVPGESTTSDTPTRGTISNCHIRWFSGSGIYCYGTGTGISNCLNVANVYVFYSTVGVNIAWLSEFHRFTNVDCRGCYYGIINNGGNNTFANCGFSKNTVGLLMDNTNGQSTNNSHGSFTNCVFNHSGNNNDGVAIQIIGCTNGEVFTGCQLFYGEIIITDSSGIIFDACNFGGSSGTSITITNGGLIMYNACCFKNAPTVTKTGNTATKMNNCYLRDGTAVTLS